jgi:hypothetical protein
VELLRYSGCRHLDGHEATVLPHLVVDLESKS